MTDSQSTKARFLPWLSEAPAIKSWALRAHAAVSSRHVRLAAVMFSGNFHGPILQWGGIRVTLAHIGTRLMPEGAVYSELEVSSFKFPG